MGMLLDGVLTAPHIDSSGEILDINGVDISDFTEGKAVINFEHSNKSPEDIIGAIVYAKKIKTASDCETDRQKMFYKLSGGPYIYIIGELFDDIEDDKTPHFGAIAAAAMVRYYHRKQQKMFIGWSIEGSTLERDGNFLKTAVARRVAFTLRPCLKSAVMGVPEAKEIESLISKAENSAIPVIEIDSNSVEISKDMLPKDKQIIDIKKALADLNKTLSAGMGNVAPSQLVGQAALTPEYISGSVKNRIKAAVRDWNRTRPLKETIKAALPEISDAYVDHFADLAEELALKKGQQKLIRIADHHAHTLSDDDQKSLVEGLYYDPNKSFTPKHDAYSPDAKNFFKLRNDVGKNVFIKQFDFSDPDAGHTYDMNHSAAHYHHIAKNFFGLGDNVPTTTSVSHPEINNGEPFQAMEFLDGAKTPFESEERWNKALDKARQSGEIQKLNILDHILGFSDRHDGNILIGKNGKISHIDNDLAFMYAGNPPDYLEGTSDEDDGLHSDPLHPETTKWLLSKDPKALAKMMYDLGIDKEKIKAAVTGLKSWQLASKKQANFRSLWNDVNNKIALSFRNKQEGIKDENPNN